jgi:hypothetical protein
LLKLLGEFSNWAEAYLEQRDLARSRHDAAQLLRLANKRRSARARGVAAGS